MQLAQSRCPPVDSASNVAEASPCPLLWGLCGAVSRLQKNWKTQEDREVFSSRKKLVPHEPLEDASAEEKIDYLATGCFEMLRPLRNHARDILVHLEVEEEKDKYMDVIMDLDTNYLFPATVRLLNRHDGDGASILKEMPFTVQTLVSKVIETKRFLSLDENQALALYAAHRECEEI